MKFCRRVKTLRVGMNERGTWLPDPSGTAGRMIFRLLSLDDASLMIGFLYPDMPATQGPIVLDRLGSTV